MPPCGCRRRGDAGAPTAEKSVGSNPTVSRIGRRFVLFGDVIAKQSFYFLVGKMCRQVGSAYPVKSVGFLDFFQTDSARTYKIFNDVMQTFMIWHGREVYPLCLYLITKIFCYYRLVSSRYYASNIYGIKREWLELSNDSWNLGLETRVLSSFFRFEHQQKFVPE